MTLISRPSENNDAQRWHDDQEIINRFKAKGYHGPINTTIDRVTCEELRHYLDEHYPEDSFYWYGYNVMWVMTKDPIVMIELKLRFELPPAE